MIGTGPSLTPSAIELVNRSDLPRFGCNNVYQSVPNLVAFLACNPEWWDHYGFDVCKYSFQKWTWDKTTSRKWGANYIEGQWGDGLSTDPNIIHYGHSSGYQLINLAYHYGVREFVLIGYDLRFPKGYDGEKHVAGGDRHFFGEYPKELQHWTRYNMGENGELNGLLECYKTIDPDQYGIRIINCSPNSALDFFEMGELVDHV